MCTNTGVKQRWNKIKSVLVVHDHERETAKTAKAEKKLKFR